MLPPTQRAQFLTVSQHSHYTEVEKEQGGEVKGNGTRLKEKPPQQKQDATVCA